MVSASDLTVHQAYRSGGARSIYYNSAIRYDRARDGAVPQKTLFFGPYAQLPAGRYAFRFDGEIDGEIDLAFTANSGARQIARFEVTSFAEPVVVELSAPVEKFEIVGAKTPTLKHLVLRCAFAEFRGSPASADDEAAAQRNAESDAEAGKEPEPAPSRSAAIAEAEQEGPSAQPEAAPRAEELAPARDADGNALSLPFALPADKLSVHDAYGAGSQNRLRAGRDDFVRQRDPRRRRGVPACSTAPTFISSPAIIVFSSAARSTVRLSCGSPRRSGPNAFARSS